MLRIFLRTKCLYHKRQRVRLSVSDTVRFSMVFLFFFFCMLILFLIYNQNTPDQPYFGSNIVYHDYNYFIGNTSEKKTSLLQFKIFLTLVTNSSFGQTSLNMVTTALWKLLLKCVTRDFITNIYIIIFFIFPSEMFKYMYQFTNCNKL